VDNTDVVKGVDSIPAAPFRVIGLQQMLLDGQLSLYAVVVPVKHFTAKDFRSRSKVQSPLSLLTVCLGWVSVSLHCANTAKLIEVLLRVEQGIILSLAGNAYSMANQA